MTDQAVSRGEFDLLRQMVGATAARVENIDGSGTKGVIVVQAQLADVVKDLAELKSDELRRAHEVNERFDAHARVHEQDQHDRVTGRRWLVGIGVAGIGSMGAVLTLLIDVLAHLH
jgi:hypothetical protein